MEDITIFTIAAKIWADKIEERCLSQTGSIQNDFYIERTKELIQKPSKKRIKAFQLILELQLIDLSTVMKDDNCILISVDYEPSKDSPLYTACRYAGISEEYLPVKSSMWVHYNDDCLEYSFGRGSQHIRVNLADNIF